MSQGVWIAILAPVFTVVAYALTMWALLRTGRDPRQSYLLGSAWGVLLTGTALVAGWTTLGVVLGLSYGVMLTFSAVGVVGSVLMLARYHSTQSEVDVVTELKRSPSGVTSRR